MARKPIDLRQYLRRPDREFWLELFRAPPRSTETSHVRRARLARYALGVAAILTLPYIIISLTLDPQGTLPVIIVNTGCAVFFTLGMWMASLDKHHAARLLLMVTLEFQIAALLWLSGSALNVAAFTLVTAALARVLYTAEEPRQQALFVGVPILTLIYGLGFAGASHVDFSSMPDWLLAGARIGNALLALASVLLILGVFEREVLRSEMELIGARESSDRLLYAVLPRKIADELRAGDRMIANRHPEVTVLFADIAGFTPWAAQQEPEVVVSLLEKIFSRFDARVTAAGAEKIKTIGDAYMVISGAPNARADHAQVIARLALALLDDVRTLRKETSIDVNLRVGMHTGPVIAGVIGALRFSYDVWGDTVNTASRMESHGEPGRIQLGAETKARLGEDFSCEPRGPVYIKGKGEMQTWWLTGAQPAPKG